MSCLDGLMAISIFGIMSCLDGLMAISIFGSYNLHNRYSELMGSWIVRWK